MKFNRLSHFLILVSLVIISISCKKEDDDNGVGDKNPVADFTFELDSTKYPEFVVKFTNKSKDYLNLSWDFGDGFSSIEENPEHKFMNAGTYTVVLKAHHNSNTNQTSREIKINTVKISSVEFIVTNSLTIGSQNYSGVLGSKGHIAFPDLARLNDGRLICVYRQGDKHQGTTNSYITKQFGSADGLTWSSPELLYDDTLTDDRDFSITRLSNGSLLGDFFKHGAGKCFVTTSNDDGKTFSNPIAINTMGGWAIPSVHGVEINGTIWIMAYGTHDANKYKNSRVYAFKSNDMGTTWTQELLIPDKYKNYNLQEPAILQVSENKLIIHTRVATSTGVLVKMLQTVSEDGGNTWSDWTSFDFIGHAPELYKTESGILISAFRELAPDLSWTRTAMIYSKDEGKTWSNPIEVAKTDYECGYPSIESMGNDKFIIAYYVSVIEEPYVKFKINAKIYDVNIGYEPIMKKQQP